VAVVAVVAVTAEEAVPQKLPTKQFVEQTTTPLMLESAQTVPAVIMFAPLIWLEEQIAPFTDREQPGLLVNIPTLLPVTTSVLLPNVPMTTLSSDDTSSIGSPEISFTDISTPVRESVMENNCPWEPCTSSTVDPDESSVVVLPEIIIEPDTDVLCSCAILF
jgi:hypothetical protein